MSDFVADTHAFYWHIMDDPRLSRAARAILESADRGEHSVWLPSISLVEMVYLTERDCMAREDVQTIFDLLRQTNDSYRLAPLDFDVANAISQVPRDLVPDMPDRIIVATALHLGLPLISRDEAITRSAVVPIIW